jgi:hypothetical protein
MTVSLFMLYMIQLGDDNHTINVKIATMTRDVRDQSRSRDRDQNSIFKGPGLGPGPN